MGNTVKRAPARRQEPLPANPAKLARDDVQKKHDQWAKTWKPHRDPAAAWI